jgi:hypothetical protein
MSAWPSAAGSSYREMQAAISHQAVGLLIRSPTTARWVMATGPASGSAGIRPSGRPGRAMAWTHTRANLPSRGRGTQRCRPDALACLGMAFAVMLSSPNAPAVHASCEDDRSSARPRPKLSRARPGTGRGPAVICYSEPAGEPATTPPRRNANSGAVDSSHAHRGRSTISAARRALSLDNSITECDGACGPHPGCRGTTRGTSADRIPVQCVLSVRPRVTSAQVERPGGRAAHLIRGFRVHAWWWCTPPCLPVAHRAGGNPAPLLVVPPISTSV